MRFHPALIPQDADADCLLPSALEQIYPAPAMFALAPAGPTSAL